MTINQEHCEYCGHLLGEEIGYHLKCHRLREPEGQIALPQYGYFYGGDPNNFTPDDEVCTPAEITRWEEACKSGKHQPPGTQFGLGVTQ